MAVIRVEKTKNYTVMSNVHLRDKALSLKAKGLLSLILSLPDGWEYSIEGLAAISKEGRDGINSGLQELEAAGYLVRKPLRGAHGHFGQVEYVIYETPHPPNTDIPDTANPVTANPTQTSTEELITDQRNKDLSNNRFNSYLAGAEASAEERRKEWNAYRELILQNIDYEILCQNQQLYQDDIDEIVELMVDTVCSKKPFIRVGGDEKPAEIVKSRLLKLDSEHIQFVLDCMRNNTTKIRNIRQYLLAALYNAPMTISNYYQSLVNHDLYGGDS